MEQNLFHRILLDNDFSKEETASYYQNGEKIQTEEMFTDKKGYLCSRNFRMENMYVSKVPFRKIWKRSAVLVTIDEDSREPQVWRVFMTVQAILF